MNECAPDHLLPSPKYCTLSACESKSDSRPEESVISRRGSAKALGSDTPEAALKLALVEFRNLAFSIWTSSHVDWVFWICCHLCWQYQVPLTRYLAGTAPILHCLVATHHTFCTSDLPSRLSGVSGHGAESSDATEMSVSCPYVMTFIGWRLLPWWVQHGAGRSTEGSTTGFVFKSQRCASMRASYKRCLQFCRAFRLAMPFRLDPELFLDSQSCLPCPFSAAERTWRCLGPWR